MQRRQMDLNSRQRQPLWGARREDIVPMLSFDPERWAWMASSQKMDQQWARLNQQRPLAANALAIDCGTGSLGPLESAFADTEGGAGLVGPGGRLWTEFALLRQTLPVLVNLDLLSLELTLHLDSRWPFALSRMCLPHAMMAFLIVLQSAWRGSGLRRPPLSLGT